MPFTKLVVLILLTMLVVGCGKRVDTPTPEKTSVQPTKSPSEEQSNRSDDVKPGVVASVGQSSPDKKVPSYEAKPTEFVVDRDGASKSVAQAESDTASGNYEEAARAYSDAMVLDPQNAEIPYKSARNFALWGKSDLAIESLGVAADLGYSDVQAVSSQSDFEPLRENPRFTKIVSRIEANR